MTRTRLSLLATTAAAALLAGCGGATTDGKAAEAAAARRSDRGMIEFARCMRAHGINMPDPVHRPGHEGLSIELPQQGPATTDAYQACGQFLQPTLELKQQAAAQRITPAIRLALTHYAQCMRTHVVPMLDPGSQGQLELGRVPGISDGFGRYSPQFHAADHACRHLLPPNIPDNGTGP
jgi:hypothetical protein